MGFIDGYKSAEGQTMYSPLKSTIQKGEQAFFQKELLRQPAPQSFKPRKTKRKLSAWNKFVKANSRKKEFRYANGKLKLKKMGIAFRRKRR